MEESDTVVNVDATILDSVKQSALSQPDRYTFDTAQVRDFIIYQPYMYSAISV